MLNTDKAIDMIPYLTGIYEKIDKAPFKGMKGKSAEEVGKKAMVSVLKNLPTFKNEIYSIVSLVCEKPVEDIKKQGIGETIKQFKEIYNDIAKDKELQSFFKEAVPSATKE